MNSFLKKYIFYCSAGELAGIGVAATIAVIVNQLVGEPHLLSEKITVLISMLIAGALEGTLLGTLQVKVIRERIRKLPANEWIRNTVVVAVLGWFFGMMPSLFFSDNNVVASSSPEPPLEVIAVLSMAMGLVTGAMFGLFQWFCLRKYVERAHRWIFANAIGWSLGLLWIYIAASWPDETTPAILIILSGIAGGILAGATIGLITGYFLLKMTQKKTTDQNHILV